MVKYYTPRQASEILGVGVETLRRWDKEGKIKTIRTAGQTRLYDISDVVGEEKKQQTTVLYCRVSSPKQKADLERQVSYMREKYPESEVIKDVGSGINFKRKGLNALLERSLSGEQLEIVVAYRDRLARFGYELLERLFQRNGGRVVVLNEVKLSPEQELTQDLLTILHVFSCRLCGIRKYKEEIKKYLPKESEGKASEDISDSEAEISV
jgi:excisionase family DNA binding protein